MRILPSILAAISIVATLPPVQAAPDGTLGIALMSATVSNGALVRGSGVTSVIKESTGVMRVVFERDLSQCTCTASGGASNGGYNSTYYATASCPIFSNGVIVATRHYDGTPSDTGFHLIVFCPK